jgi:FkbM family methyltransferase
MASQRLPIMQETLSLIRTMADASVSSVVDIGAQRKTDFLMDAYPDKMHHLFEPVAAYHDELRRNYESRNIKYTLYPVALGKVDGILYLHNQSLDGSGSITHSQLMPTKQPQLPHLVGITEVQCKRLDHALTDNALSDLSYLIKLDVDGLEEDIINSGRTVISKASFVIIEASIGKQNLCSRIMLLESCGFRVFDICDNAYYFGQLALVDIVMINNRLRTQCDAFRPWEKNDGKVVWTKWQHGFRQ